MKALVTGGAGFIGSNLVDLLLSEHWSVRVLDNLSTGYRRNLDGRPVEFLEGDIRDRDLVMAATKDVDAVFHLAACIGNLKSLTEPHIDAEINAVGTAVVLDAARRNGVPRVVYSSSAAIFGELQGSVIAEDHPQNPSSPYGVSKLAGEKYALCFGTLYNMTVVCLRYFNVYGVHQRYDAYGNVISIFAHRLHAGQPLTIYGDGEQTRDFVNAKDVARANLLAATRVQRSAVYNVGCGESITVNYLAALVQEASGIPASVEHAPPRGGEVRHCKADNRRLRTDLGFTPSADIRAGLQEYFRWFAVDRRIAP
jgi:nucleoside-diphosphate-sugar epimerase